MKHSTKILAGTVLVVILVIISHYVALFAMKRAGAYSEIETNELSKPLVAYPENIRIVKVKGFNTVSLMMADTFHYKYSYYDEYDHVRWNTRGDTLILEGDTTRYDTLRNGVVDTVYERADNSLTIYTTGKEKLILIECTANFAPSEKPIELDVELTGTVLTANWYDDTTQVYNYEVKMLRASCDSSDISLVAQWRIYDMAIKLDGSSTFADRMSDIKGGTILYEKTSMINLTGYNIGRVRLNRNLP